MARPTSYILDVKQEKAPRGSQPSLRWNAANFTSWAFSKHANEPLMETENMDWIIITAGNASLRVRPENAEKTRDALAKRYRKRRITNAPRKYPRFIPGMTTGGYVEADRAANSPLSLAGGVDKTWPGWDRPAPMLDPSTPECEEVTSDPLL